ncbi:MAG: DUF72 domain-containing protein [Nitrospira sp.]|nr:DUF72 domain-containing protein [Nitrospira sp.]
MSIHIFWMWPCLLKQSLLPTMRRSFPPILGPFILEFQRHDLSASESCSRLETFLGQLPTDFRYAVEIRNDRLLGSEYRKVLERHAAAYVSNHWSWMPSLAKQHQRLERFPAPFVVLRLLTPLGMTSEQANDGPSLITGSFRRSQP